MTRETITQYIAAEWADYTAADCLITQITDPAQDCPRNVREGAQAGDWLIESRDGQAAAVVRIVDGRAVEIRAYP